jgi:hypothetical protein
VLLVIIFNIFRSSSSDVLSWRGIPAVSEEYSNVPITSCPFWDTFTETRSPSDLSHHPNDYFKEADIKINA